MDYQSVEQLLTTLRIGPYARADLSLAELFYRYWHWLLCLLIAVIILSVLLARLKFLNSKLFHAEQNLLETNESLKGLTLIDSLTGLGNRRKLHEHLEQSWGQICRDKSTVCILLMDIDFFKNYNDSHGHIEGDHCLKQVADTIKSVFRRADELCIRYGGEEFLILCRNCDIYSIEKRADEFHMAIQALHIPHNDSQVAPIVTVSIGIAMATAEKGATAEDLIKLADIALYKAKKAGRNRTMLSE